MKANRFREWYRSGPGRPLILAHRGDSSHAPENTLEAAALGFEAGSDGWELDVRLTSDGVPILLHDESLLRTTDVARRFAGDPRGEAGFLVGEFSLDEVRTLDAGSWFLDRPEEPRSARGFGTFDRLAEPDRARYASGSVRVPTLAEALALTAEADGMVNVEVKPSTGDPGRLVEAVLKEVRKSDAADRVAISSFDRDVVAAVVALEPLAATGALVLRWPGPADCGRLLALGADALHSPPFEAGESPFGLPALIYTVNDAGPSGLASRLFEAGATGLFTDDPTSMAVRFEITPSARRTRPHWVSAGHRWGDR